MAIDRMRGAADVPLSPQGHQQVQELGKRIKALGGLSTVHASEASRTQDTARAISDNVITNPNLGDMAYGALEGMASADAIPILNRFINNAQYEPLPGIGPSSRRPGESFNEFKQRVLMTMYGIMQSQGPHDRIGVVANRRVIKTIEGWLDKKALPTFNVNPDIVTNFTDGDISPGDVYHMYKNGGMWRMENLDMYSRDKMLDPGIYLIRHGVTPWNGEHR